MIAQQPQTRTIKILTTDAYLPEMCMNRSHRDLSPRLATLFHTIADLLNRPSPPQVHISWTPIAKGLRPIRRLKAIAADRARLLPTLPSPPPTKAHLRATMRKEAISQWQNSWREAPKRQPTYLALTSPPDGKPAPFVQGLTNFPRPIFTTGIRLLTGHAFTGEYNARHRPQSPPLPMWRGPSNGAPRHHILPIIRSRNAAHTPPPFRITITLYHLRHQGRRSRSGSIPCRDASVLTPEAARATAGGFWVVAQAAAATITSSHTQSPTPHHHAYIPVP